MTATVLSQAYAATSASASTTQAGYPAANALIPGVNRGWKSSATGSQWIQLDLGAPFFVSGVALQAISGIGVVISVYADTSATPTTLRGSITPGTDGNGRSKGSLAFAATVRYIRFYLVTGASTVGVGSMYAFATSTSINRGPLYGQTNITCIDPQVRNELPNGVIETYSAGASTTDIQLGFGPAPTDDLDAIRRAARAGPCWLDLGVTAQRDRQWPVRYADDKSVRKIDRFNRESQSLTFREIT